METINYTKSGVPFLHKIRIQPIVARNIFGVTETISFLGTSTANFEIEELIATVDVVDWVQVWKMNDAVSLSTSDDDRSWNSASSMASSEDSTKNSGT